MEVYLEKERRIKKVNFDGRAEGLLKKLKINSEACIVVKNNKIITIDTKLKNKDRLKILSVVSGG